KDDDAMVRALAIRGLSEAGGLDTSATDAALRDQDLTVRLAAIEALSDSREPLFVDRLRTLAADPDPSVAASACAVMLGGSSRSHAVDELERLLSHADSSVRAEAASRLRSAGAE